MEPIRTKVDANVAKPILRRNLPLVIMSISIGLICVVGYFVFSAIGNSWGDGLNIVMLAAGGLVLLLGLFLVYSLIQSSISADRNQYVSVANFEEEEINIEFFKEEEKIQTVKLHYRELLSFIESKEYIYLKPTRNLSLPIAKAEGLADFLENKGVKRIRMGVKKGH